MHNPFADVPPLRIPESAPKAHGSPDRCVRLADTFARIPEFRQRYGITRIGDTTYLDRTDIPTFCAVIPKSRDLLSVYNGKGATREAAILSAVMEAVERQAGAEAELHLPTVRMRVRDVLDFVDLRAMGLREDTLDLTTTCVAATELLSGSVVPMPLALVQCPWYGEKLFSYTTTNGLASGNNLVEALYHALAELIERHIWSMFYIRSQLVPRFFLGPESPDAALAREIILPTGDGGIDALVERITSVGMSVRMLALEEPPLPLAVLSGVIEATAAQPLAHNGLGCSLSSRHAIERALTECVQSRVVDIQAAREDIMRPDEPEGIFGSHARRRVNLPKGRWYFDLPQPPVALSDLPERMSSDLSRDLRAVLESLSAYGIDAVYAVELPAWGEGVVRAIVPQLEKTVIDGTIGPLGRREFNPFYAHAQAYCTRPFGLRA